MNLRSEAGSWTIHDLAGDLFVDSPVSCAESPWEVASDACVRESSAEPPQDGRHRAPSPSIACIDPRLTLLWPSLQTPPASPSEVESSVDGDWGTYDDLLQDSAPAHVEEGEGTAPTWTFKLDVETGSNGPNLQLLPTIGESSPSRERKPTRSTTQVTTRAAASRNSTAGKAMVKGPDKTHTKWKWRAKGEAAAPSGPSTCISRIGRYPGPGAIGKGELEGQQQQQQQQQQAEGIEKIHMKLWKCRIGGCNKTFHRKGDAVRHLQTTARHNGKAVVCSCGAPFSRHDALKRHQRLCNGPVN